MNVIICRSRNFSNKSMIKTLILELQQKYKEELLIIEGEAEGADSIARDIAENLNIKVKKFPANWNKYHKAAGPIRNKQMIVEGKANIVYAFYSDKSKSKGTANMVMQAQKANLPVIEYESKLS